MPVPRKLPTHEAGLVIEHVVSKAQHAPEQGFGVQVPVAVYEPVQAAGVVTVQAVPMQHEPEQGLVPQLMDEVHVPEQAAWVVDVQVAPMQHAPIVAQGLG